MKQGQIAHLDRNPGNNAVENLCFLCLNHHNEYDSRPSQSKSLTNAEVKAFREALYSKLTTNEPESPRIPDAGEVRRARAAISELDSYLEIAAIVGGTEGSISLPDDLDLAGEWRSEYDPSTGFPVLCKGNFTGRSDNEYAFFAFVGNDYGVFAAIDQEDGEPVLVELERSTGRRPQRRYVTVFRNREISVSRSVWKHGGPRVVRLRTDAIAVGGFESAACLYFWRDGKFRRQWLTD